MNLLSVLILICLLPSTFCADWVSAVMYHTQPACTYTLADTIVILTEVHSVSPRQPDLFKNNCFMHTRTLLANYDPITNSDYYIATCTLDYFSDEFPSINCVLLQNVFSLLLHALRTTTCSYGTSPRKSRSQLLDGRI